MRPESEIERHLEAGPRRGPAATQRLLGAARRRHAVQGVGDGLEQRRLARAVGPDDADQPGAELQIGQLVLPEVQRGEVGWSCIYSSPPIVLDRGEQLDPRG